MPDQSPQAESPKTWETLAAHRGLIWATVFIGAAIRLVQLVYNRSLWIDEALLVRSIIDEGYLELLEPMSNLGQVAPIAFLWVERTAVLTLGVQEWSLRLFPFLCSLAMLPLLHRFTLRLSGSTVIAYGALLWFALNPFAVYYASEVKQYASDLFVGTGLYYLGITTRFPLSQASAIRLALIGAAAVFFSHTAMLILATVGLWWLIGMMQRKKIEAALILVGVAWIISIGINYLAFVRNHPSQPWMIKYWQEQNAFMPKNFLEGRFWNWWATQIHEVFHKLLGFFEIPYLHWLFLALCALGLYRFYRNRNYAALYFCLFPILLHLALSATYRYPFSSRLILYQAPIYLVLLGAGIAQLSHWTKPGVQPLAIGLVALLPLAQLSTDFPTARQHIRPCITFMNAHRSPEQRVVVYRPARHAWWYYRRHGIADTNQPTVYTPDPTERDPAAYLREIKSHRGESWCIFTHVKLFPPTDQADFEELKGLLEQAGEVKKAFASQGAFVYLVEVP